MPSLSGHLLLPTMVNQSQNSKACVTENSSASRDSREIQAMLRRACRLSLEFATAKKRHEIDRLLEAYRGAVNVYIRSLWQVPGALDKETLARLPAEETRLQRLHKDQALRQSLSIVSSTRESAKVCGAQAQCPRFTGMAVLCHGVLRDPLIFRAPAQ